jgi:hypothetical protein
MEAARTSETSVDNHFTRQYNPEDSSEHHTRRRENLKSHILFCKQPSLKKKLTLFISVKKKLDIEVVVMIVMQSKTSTTHIVSKCLQSENQISAEFLLY